MVKENKYIQFLNELQQSGRISMMAARAVLEEAYSELSLAQAGEILKDWMENWESYQTKELSGKPKWVPPLIL